jgi:hypothetical protein
MDAYLIRGGSAGSFAPLGLPPRPRSTGSGAYGLAAGSGSHSAEPQPVGGPEPADGPSATQGAAKEPAKLTGASVKDSVTWLGWAPVAGTYSDKQKRWGKVKCVGHGNGDADKGCGEVLPGRARAMRKHKLR